MQTLNSINKLIAAVQFGDWKFKVDTNKGVPYVQILFYATSNFSDDETAVLQSCRKWMLSFYMCDEEIVSTAFKAMLAAVEHEAREQFTWEGQAIYRPHLDIRTLHKISSQNLVDKRDETNYKAEFDELTGSTAPGQKFELFPRTEDELQDAYEEYKEAERYERPGYDTMGVDNR